MSKSNTLRTHAVKVRRTTLHAIGAHLMLLQMREQRRRLGNLRGSRRRRAALRSLCRNRRLRRRCCLALSTRWSRNLDVPITISVNTARCREDRMVVLVQNVLKRGRQAECQARST